MQTNFEVEGYLSPDESAIQHEIEQQDCYARLENERLARAETLYTLGRSVVGYAKLIRPWLTNAGRPLDCVIEIRSSFLPNVKDLALPAWSLPQDTITLTDEEDLGVKPLYALSKSGNIYVNSTGVGKRKEFLVASDRVFRSGSLEDKAALPDGSDRFITDHYISGSASKARAGISTGALFALEGIVRHILEEKSKVPNGLQGLSQPVPSVSATKAKATYESL